MSESPQWSTIRNEAAIVALAGVSAALLIFEIASDLDAGQRAAIERVDIAIAFIFLAEFVVRFFRATSKAAFLRTSWWELFAAIPITGAITQAARGLRLLRIIRLVRLLRLVRFATRARLLVQRSGAFVRGAWLVEISTTVAALVSAAALAFHYFEHGTNPNVHSVGDSFWWAIVTVTTVGYGDIYPVTTAGRIVAVALMIVGIGTLGIYTAAIASFVVKAKLGE